jgi:hypothetical protein
MAWDKVAAISGLFFGTFCHSAQISRYSEASVSLGYAFYLSMPINALNSCGTTSQKGFYTTALLLFPTCAKHKIDHVSGKVKCWDNLFSVVLSKAWKNEDRKSRTRAKATGFATV